MQIAHFEVRFVGRIWASGLPRAAGGGFVLRKLGLEENWVRLGNGWEGRVAGQWVCFAINWPWWAIGFELHHFATFLIVSCLSGKV